MPALRILTVLPLLAAPGLSACVESGDGNGDDPARAKAVEAASTARPLLRLDGRAGSDRSLRREELVRWGPGAGTLARWDEDGDGDVSGRELARGVFTRWDTNRDGVLSRVEWRAGAESWFAAEVARGTWTDWDEDRDEALHRAEFRGAFERNRLVERIDRDRDGGVSEAELLHWSFEVVDANGDGRLDPAERRAAVDAVPTPVRSRTSR